MRVSRQGVTIALFREWGVSVVLISTFFFLGGCESAAEHRANQAVSDYFVGDYEHARLLLEPLSRQTDENFVLNNERLGSTDLAQNRMDEAESAFLRAYEVINSVGVNDGGRSLGATLISEKIKVWKGEPFERAMANFYLGMIYYQRHDYNNARAAFENALFKLRDYGEDNQDQDKYSDVESNFMLAYVMLARSWQQLGEDDKARQNFDRVAKLRPDLAGLANFDLNRDANLLLVVDWGNGPMKVTNADGAIVGFGPPPNRAGPIYMPGVAVDGRQIDTSQIGRPPVDLLVLAQDRRWQSIDTIRVVKSAVGTGLMVAGAYEATRGRQKDTELGVGLLAAGLILKATSQADVRQWEMLPRVTFILPLRVSPGTHQVTVAFRGGVQQTLQNITVTDHQDTLYYLHMTPWATYGPVGRPRVLP